MNIGPRKKEGRGVNKLYPEYPLKGKNLKKGFLQFTYNPISPLT